MALLKTTLPGCDDGPFRQAFKALFPGHKEEKKMVFPPLLLFAYQLPSAAILMYSGPLSVVSLLHQLSNFSAFVGVVSCRLLIMLKRYPQLGNVAFYQLPATSLVQRSRVPSKGLLFRLT